MNTPTTEFVRPMSCDATEAVSEVVSMREYDARREQAAVLEQHAVEQRVLAENPCNVAVTVMTGAEIKMLAAMARDFEADGDEPALVWYRDDAGVIRGVVLVGHLSRFVPTLCGQRAE